MATISESAKQPLIQVAKAVAERWLSPSTCFESCDQTCDGLLSIEEFGNLLTQLRISIPDNVAVEAFAALDSNGCGMISKSEFADVLLHLDDEVVPSTSSKLPSSSRTERFVALVAHNDMKNALMAFVHKHLDFFSQRRIVTTGSTGRALEKKLGLNVAHKVCSGPLGGDQDIGGMISRAEVAAVFFFRDPLSAHPHDADIVALGRLCDVHNVATANNPSSAGALLAALTDRTEYQALLQPLNREDSDIVKAYKARQASVIAAVSGNSGKPLSRPSSGVRLPPIEAGIDMKTLSTRETGTGSDVV